MTSKPPYKDPLILLAMAVVLLAFTMPSFVKGEEAVSLAEHNCAVRGAQRYAYRFSLERAFQLDYRVQKEDPAANLYQVFPLSFFGLPWRAATVECEPAGDGTYRPLSGWITDQYSLP